MHEFLKKNGVPPDAQYVPEFPLAQNPAES
jgi:hypothetical protein